MEINIKEVLRDYKERELNEELIEALKDAARKCRLWALTMTTAAKSGHIGGSLSSMEMYLLIYGLANLTPQNARSTDRDHVVISHGHTSPGAYAALAYYGFIDAEEVMALFRKGGSPFPGHVEREVPGIDWSSGNLGQGLAAGVGFALAKKAKKSKDHVFVLMGDGEQVKGQVAEARRVAVKNALDNITVLVDWNDIQISGKLEEVMPFNIVSLWEADGWKVYEADGHDFASIYRVVRQAMEDDLPSVVLCRTTMGKGVSFMEGTPDFHGKAASEEQYKKAVMELGGTPELLDRAKVSRIQMAGKKTIESPRKDFGVFVELGKPRTYLPDVKTDCRSAFGEALVDIGLANYKIPGKTPILVFDCDLAGSVKVNGFAKSCPDWFFEMGIQEHATATVAGAASCGGVVSVWADFGVFGLTEVYNQQRLNDINETNLKLILTHIGLDVGEDGKTHQCIDYIGLMRNMFGWKLVLPADPNQTDRVVRWAIGSHGNVCVAMGRSKVPVITKEDGTCYYDEEYEFEYGKSDLLRDGTDGAILCCGHMVYRAIEAWEKLKAKGISVKIFNVSAPLAIDKATIEEASKTGLVVTYEDHHWRSGLGSIVAEKMLEFGCVSKFVKLGVHRYGDSGTAEEVISLMGLSPDNLVEVIESNLK